ncbi:M23 family metallopeptidase [Microbacterium sp. MAHUQ-60]|uniref:M23 family metallopeptidase n=1 Tax=unclassified Microbacterium TaxID=2609290 RepID=UPI0036203B52
MTSDAVAASPVESAGAALSRRALRLALAASAAPAAAVAAETAAAPASEETEAGVDVDAADPASIATLVVETVLPAERDDDVTTDGTTSEVGVSAVATETETVRVTEPRSDDDGAGGVAGSGPAVDAFTRASGAFGFAPVVDDEPAVPMAEQSVEVGAAPASEHVVPRRHRVAKRLVAAGASLGVMTVAGFMAVSMTLPASAVAAVRGGAAPVASLVTADGATSNAKVPDDEIQAFVASAGVQDEVLARSDEYSSVSLLEVAAEENIRYSDSLYTNDSQAAIQWPFMVGVAMSSPYGMRNGRMHAGIDLVPGAGATIQAIADGTVRIATESGGAYGVTAYVDHVIDGKVVTSHYAHMQHGSLAVTAGQKVKVGDTIGKVGNTGRSYGAHLHFEIIINGSTVNPLVWMRENAGRYSY